MIAEPPIQKRETPLAQTEPVRGGPTYLPAVDILEQNDKLLLVADMPGVRGDDLDIQYERGTLTIHGQAAPRQDEAQTNYLLREYGVGDFCRTFQVGESVDASKISAELRDGVLTLHLPKAEALLARKITVRNA
jgi:HSP20 family protein